MPWPILLAALFVTASGQARSAGYESSQGIPLAISRSWSSRHSRRKKGFSWSSAESGAVGVTPWRLISRTTRTFEPGGRTTFAGSLKVNFSPENQNRSFLRRYPRIPGYPHIFVLESDGRFLHSQGTAELESGRSYSRRNTDAVHRSVENPALTR